jgi:poly(A)-specific ribonuclease
VLHDDHQKYSEGGQLHEAGYDSYLTAKILIKLSTHLRQSGGHQDWDEQYSTTDEEYFTPSEGEEESVSSIKKSGAGSPIPPKKLQYLQNGSHVPHITSLDGVSDTISLMSFDNPLSKPKAVPEVTSNGKGILPSVAHATNFDALKDLTEEVLTPKKKGPRRRQGRAKSAQRSLIDEHPVSRTGLNDGLMPQFGDPFWKVYGNKLRVFGTVEGVCNLNPT